MTGALHGDGPNPPYLGVEMVDRQIYIFFSRLFAFSNALFLFLVGFFMPSTFLSLFRLGLGLLNYIASTTDLKHIMNTCTHDFQDIPSPSCLALSPPMPQACHSYLKISVNAGCRE
jgi:hypothetical protein